MLEITCPNCKVYFSVADEVAGRKVRCGACKTVFTASEAGIPVAPQPLGGMPERRCPDCGEPLAAAAILCGRCGLNLDTGQRANTAELEEDGPEEDSGPSVAMQIVMLIAEVMPGLFRPGVLVFSIILTLVAFAIMVLGLVVLQLGALFAGIAICAFALVTYGQAIGMMLTGTCVLLSEALAELTSNQWLIFFVILFAPLAAFIFMVHASMAS